MAGRFFVPLLAIVPAMMPFFVDFPSDAPVRNPVFRIGLVSIGVGIGWAIVWYAKKTFPKEIWLGDQVELHYLNKTVTSPMPKLTELK